MPNSEQTASVLSLMLYNFLDPIIFLGYRSAHLSIDQLPPLADYDQTKNLVKRSFPVSVSSYWQVMLILTRTMHGRTWTLS